MDRRLSREPRGTPSSSRKGIKIEHSRCVSFVCYVSVSLPQEQVLLLLRPSYRLLAATCDFYYYTFEQIHLSIVVEYNYYIFEKQNLSQRKRGAGNIRAPLLHIQSSSPEGRQRLPANAWRDISGEPRRTRGPQLLDGRVPQR